MSSQSDTPSIPRRLRQALRSCSSAGNRQINRLALGLRRTTVQAAQETSRVAIVTWQKVQRPVSLLLGDAKRLAQADRSLQRQLGLLLVCMSLAFAGVSLVLQTQLIMPAFVSLERQGAVRDVNRCLAGINRDLELLGFLSSDWGVWDDTYQFVQDRNENFSAANLVDETFSNSHVALIAILNSNRELVWGGSRDSKTLEKIELPGLWKTLTDRAFPLTQHANIHDAHRGLVRTEAGPMLLAAHPIITSKREGPIRGTVIMGRLLNQPEIAELASRAEVDVTARVVEDESLPGSDKGILEQLRETGEPVIQAADAKTLLAYAKVDDIYGKPALLLRVNVPREVTAQGNVAGFMATWGAILGSLAIMGAAALLIRRRVVKPLEQIVAHAHQIGEKADLKVRLNSERNDEIGQLSKALDEMMECLAISRKRVLAAAHQAGMADVAGEVLHNVGNVINSAKSSLEQLESQSKSRNLAGLYQAGELLEQNSGRIAEFFSQDPRGPKLVHFLVKTAAAIKRESAENQENLARIGKSIRHIQNVISRQEQSSHQGNDFVCEMNLAEAFREVIALNHGILECARVDVRVVAEGVPDLSVNPNKLTQVLVNLVRNSVQAMEGTEEGSRVLSLLARQTGEGIEIEVHDTGCGMSDEAKANLFRHGFTTKPNGQGIGLHYCANAVQSLGGQIFASSDGPGRGASFHLHFPKSAVVRAPELASAA